MESRTLTFIAAMTLFAALALPVPLAAQEQKEAKKHHRYRFVDVGTFGGPASYLENDFTGGAGRISGILNNRGTVAGAADTSTPDPNYGHGSGFFPRGVMGI
jgi:hypothetical protein